MTLKPEFVEPGGVLVLRPEGPITVDDVAAIRAAADTYLAAHRRLGGLMIETRAFPGWADLMALAEHLRFVAEHVGRVRRVALVTDSVLAPAAEFLARHVADIEFRHFPFNEDDIALAWLRSG